VLSERQEAKNMSEKKVTRVVKYPKGINVRDKDGAFYLAKQGDRVSLPLAQAALHVKRGNLYAVGEFEGAEAAKKAALKASQEEKAERAKDEKPADKKEDKPVSKGADSKGS